MFLCSTTMCKPITINSTFEDFLLTQLKIALFLKDNVLPDLQYQTKTM
jgi:hypothetical protein